MELPPRPLDADQPWRGLDYYWEEDQSYFYGRWHDSRKLYRLITRETLTVLFGESGLGKTSLLNAGVFPLLREAGYFPVRIRLRYEQGSEPGRLAEQIENRIAEEAERSGHRFSRPSGTATLLEFFQGCRIWNRSVELLTPVIVLDQFEEIFTRGYEEPVDPFLGELAELIESASPALHLVGDRAENPYHVVLSLREDYLAQLEDLKRLIPSLAVNRFRLLPMTGLQALESVLNPAKGAGLVTEDVARRIVLFAAGAADAAHGTLSDEILEDVRVEPFLLSLFCEQLNLRRIDEGQDRITSDLVTVAGASILETFYERRVRDLSPRVQRFIEEALLTQRGHRQPVGLFEAEDRWKVTESDVDRLVNRRLLRREEVLGRPGAELIHDVLCPVVRQSRDRRRWRKRMALGGAVGVLLVVGIIAALSLAGRFAVLVADLQQTEQELEAKIEELEQTQRDLRREIEQKEIATQDAEKARREVEARERALVAEVDLKEAAQRRAEERSRALGREVGQTVRAAAYLFDRLGLDLVAADERERLGAFEEAATWAVGHEDAKIRTRGHFFRGVTSPPDEELGHFATALERLELEDMHDFDDERLRVQLYRRQGRALAELGKLYDSRDSFDEAVGVGESLLTKLEGSAGETDLLSQAKAHEEVAQVALELAFVSRALGGADEDVAEAFAKPGRLRDRADQLRQDHSRLSLDRSAKAGGAKAAGNDFMGSASEFLSLLARGTGLVVQADRRGALAKGGMRWFAVPRELEGKPALIFGLCDKGCSDLDLRLFDDDGTEIASDTKDSDFPNIQYEGRGSVIEVAMEGCQERTCEYGLLVLTASGAPTTKGALTAEQFVDSKLDLALQYFEEGGSAESERWRGTLETGGRRSVLLPPRAVDTDAVVIALCEQSCTNLDLVARDAQGRELKADRLDDSVPMVRTPAEAASVEVVMRKCREPQCHYAVSLIEGTSLLEGTKPAATVK